LLGVMAGDATDTSVMFWTRYDGTESLTLRVLEMNGSRIVAMRFNGTVTPGAGGFVRAIVTGLRAHREHMYAFLVTPTSTPTGRSAVGRVVTAPSPEALVPLVFGGTSCSNQRHRPFPALEHAGARRDLDFFIHAGDHVYTDYGDNASTLAEYRAKYVQNWGSSGLRALHRGSGMYLTWDDHEVFNNWDPETVGASRLAAARSAFFEHRATRRNTTVPNRIWRSFRWGNTAEIFILDCRSERLPSTRSTDPARRSQYISRAQLDWLTAGLRASPCVFKLIVNSVPIVDRAGGDSDNWNGYASQRREILNVIAMNNLRGVVWLSGDVHFGGICRVEAAGPWNNIWEVIMGPAGADRDTRPSVVASQWPVLVHGIHNYTLFHADPLTRTLTVEFINGAGERIPNSRWSHVF
jgi:alkaline phosphatase D